MGDAIAMVLSGGGARGAYEFGALEVLAPVLDAPPRIIVGTSAGALGAAFLAAEAQRPLGTAARHGAEAWHEVEFGDVAGPLLSPKGLARALLYGLEVLGVPVPAVRSLLDAAPQAATIARLIDFGQLARNVDERRLDAAAVVATSYATARSVVFHHGGASPPADDKRGIDYLPAALAAEHVQASSAIPVLFPAVRVAGQWYGDGGTRSDGSRARSTAATTPARAGCAARTTSPCSGGCWTPAATRSAASCSATSSSHPSSSSR
jgi:NTE family protein